MTFHILSYDVNNLELPTGVRYSYIYDKIKLMFGNYVKSYIASAC